MSTRLEVRTEVNKRQEAQPREADFRQRIEDNFQSAFAEVYRTRNQEADAPRVKVKMFYSDHETPEDLSGLIGEFAGREESQDNIHVYFPEAFGWRQEDLNLFRQVSFGEITREELQKRLRKYRPALSKPIKDTDFFHMPIMIIDVPAGHRLEKESDKAWHYEPPLEGDFSEALNYTRAFLKGLATRQNERENYMLLQITPGKVEELLKTYPRLVGDKKELNILFSLGLGHSSMPPDYPENSFADQGVITHRFGIEIDDELASRIFLESFFESMLYREGRSGPREWLTKSSRKISMLKRKIFSQFGRKDAERIFNYCKEKRIPPKDEFNRIFIDKEIVIPDNERELDAFLAKSDFPQRVST